VHLEEMTTELQPILDKVWIHCEQTGIRGRTVTLKVKYADFRQITRSRSLAGYVESRSALEEVSLGLLSSLYPVGKGVRLLGVSLSMLNTDEGSENRQLALGL
jgi:DNA polymerase-4